MKNIFLSSMLVGVVMLGGLGVSTKAEAAATACTPTVALTESKDTSVRLNVTCASAKNIKVTVKVEIKNKDKDNKTTTRAFEGKASKDGVMKIKLDSLDTGTSYDFRAKVKKSGDDKYSVSSVTAGATTKGASYSPVIETVSSITDDSVKLTVNTAKLKKKAVNLQVLYKKKTSWTTRDFTLTLDNDGDGKVTVNGLSSGTAYEFKVRVKKTVDTKYSTYSAIKGATTEE
jgi:hypothetical protein